MAHPPRFSDDDPLLLRLRTICLALPQAKEKVSHGMPSFYTVKVFAQFGAARKGDHYAEEVARSLVFVPDPEERSILLDDPRFFVPAYLGPSGWLGLRLGTAPVDWAEVAELVDMSYRNTAPRRLVASLDRGFPDAHA